MLFCNRRCFIRRLALILELDVDGQIIIVALYQIAIVRIGVENSQAGRVQSSRRRAMDSLQGASR